MRRTPLTTMPRRRHSVYRGCIASRGKHYAISVTTALRELTRRRQVLSANRRTHPMRGQEAQLSPIDRAMRRVN